MIQVKFGTDDEAGFDLEVSPDLIAVRTRSGRPLTEFSAVMLPESVAVADGGVIASFPDAGVEIHRVPATTFSMEERLESLRMGADVRFAGSVLVFPGTDEPVLYTENLYVRFKPDVPKATCERIIHEAGLAVREVLGYAANAYSVFAPNGTGQRVFEIALQTLKRPEVLYCHPELISTRYHKQLFPQQWHLHETRVNGHLIQAHANVAAAHEITRGEGVTIAIIDDGIDIDHPEFSRAGKVVGERDATNRNSNPRPRGNNHHGTPCAGVACAEGLHGASGVAPAANLMPIRLASGLGSFREAEAFRWAAENGADIISCSWGPKDGDWMHPTATGGKMPLPASTRDAIDYAVTKGRGGRGCLVLFAAGNGRESVDDDGYASYEKVIAVAACNDRGTRSVYSDFGKAIWCAFPSDDKGHAPLNHMPPLTPGIWTTDRLGSEGYNRGNAQTGDANGDYVHDFGGTSSACPGAAGVAALALTRNPELLWHELKQVLRSACDQIDPQGGEYDAEGRSPFYGYGRLNALRAIQLAGQATRPVVSFSKQLQQRIPDMGSTEATIDVTDTSPVERVMVSVLIEHSWVGDLVVSLIPPQALGSQPIVLHNREGANDQRIDMTYSVVNAPSFAAFQDQSCAGTWTLRIEDTVTPQSGTLRGFGIHLTLLDDVTDGGRQFPQESRPLAATTAVRRKAATRSARGKGRARQA